MQSAIKASSKDSGVVTGTLKHILDGSSSGKEFKSTLDTPACIYYKELMQARSHIQVAQQPAFLHAKQPRSGLYSPRGIPRSWPSSTSNPAITR